MTHGTKLLTTLPETPEHTQKALASPYGSSVQDPSVPGVCRQAGFVRVTVRLSTVGARTSPWP